AHVLKRMQSFDPPGIFARNLRECLALQLTDSRQLDAKMAVLLNHLDLLAQHRIPELLTACGVKQDELVEMIGRIRRLDPKPAERFLNNAARTVVPDILMRAQADGSWFIELNSDTLPRVLINQHYFTTIKREARSRVERNYLTERYTAASWLIKSLHQRATTILKVAEEIIRRQDAFFAYGVQYLKPMTLRDVADTIGMHESTVSRVTTNKFIATPRGLFELKYFFTTAIADTDGGNTHSAESVRQRIKAMIDAETAETVISDEMIGKILKKDGIDIARRTVAKYREAMSIPSSVQRRRMKSMWSGSGM
ncbi:MAG: RNA polymerase factor sigma-54, partial [Pseudomonadota bacterium]|nr:RNA polymerase factor sigma-54 [Pseudomonadota bacterium]